ncbi:Putative ribonuclease H protein [Dendrobium catenatum]|uniref:Ribonuclease H protein n=1 Tax=Dendrobium catenatum TaxID=906689 RepID=A0A2I0VP79_9ASPA|nr:Putative ribonuclease H protein [Dendrobium catenatum]
MLNIDPQNLALNYKLKSINSQLSDCSASWTNWLLQRAKLKWLSKGEDDLKFLYARLKKRRNHSSSTLVASEDPTIRQDLINSITQHFEKLFNATPPVNTLESFSIPKGNVIPSHLSHLLTVNVSDVEIKEAIFLGSSKSSPGPDGFNFEFYKSTWLITGPLVCKAVKSFFSKGYLPKMAKATAIALIPKSTHASNISDYRPIALCNVFYKIISKILASRMKEIMPFIIGNNQAGFIKKRIATDNILLASEILSDFKKSAKNKLMCAKLDIRKAFDSVSRAFILSKMKQKGFPSSFIHWVKACILDVHFSICIDGALEGYFNSSYGIRQGCPLSPYLFCIAMDVFSCLIDNDSNQDNFIGFHKHGVNISHLLYADDLLIFGEASLNNRAALRKILDIFAKVSGLLVNHEKSQIIISSYISNPMDFCEALHMPSYCVKMTYLGLPISVKKCSKYDFLPLMHSIANHLAGWKARLLSMGGRLQFLKYTVCNTIAYWIRGSIIPKSCIKTLSRICAKFLFFGDPEAKKLHLITWKRTCKPKLNGGLGIPDLIGLQFATMSSLLFRFYNSKSILFNYLNAKYATPWTPALSRPSPLWNEIGKVALIIKPDICFD